MTRVSRMTGATVLVIMMAIVLFAHVPQCFAAPFAGEIVLGFKQTYGTSKTHLGADVAWKEGSDLYAPISGEISFIGKVPGSAGLNVTAVTISTSGGKQVTLNPFSSSEVKKGENVSKGDMVGTLSGVGDPSSSVSHVHLSLRVNGVYKDPSGLIETVLGIDEGTLPKAPVVGPTKTPVTPNPMPKSASVPKPAVQPKTARASKPVVQPKTVKVAKPAVNVKTVSQAKTSAASQNSSQLKTSNVTLRQRVTKPGASTQKAKVPDVSSSQSVSSSAVAGLASAAVFAKFSTRQSLMEQGGWTVPDKFPSDRAQQTNQLGQSSSGSPLGAHETTSKNTSSSNAGPSFSSYLKTLSTSQMAIILYAIGLLIPCAGIGIGTLIKRTGSKLPRFQSFSAVRENR